MRENVLQTWTPAWLVLAALLMVGASASARYRTADDPPRMIEPSSGVAYCAAPALAAVRQIRVARPLSPRTAAMLLVLATGRGRIAGLAR